MTGFENDFAYALVPTAQISQAMINCIRASVYIKDQTDLRTSLDGLTTIAKFSPDTGAPFVTYKWYSLSEILPILQGPGWLNDEVR